MNKKYIKYIDYIVSDIELPYLKYLEQYGLKDDEYKLVLSKIFNQPVTIRDNLIYDDNDKIIYFEKITGYWYKNEYDTNGKEIYYEDSDGYWVKREYDTNDKIIYSENSGGHWEKREYDKNGNQIYSETSVGVIIDNR